MDDKYCISTLIPSLQLETVQLFSVDAVSGGFTFNFGVMKYLDGNCATLKRDEME